MAATLASVVTTVEVRLEAGASGVSSRTYSSVLTQLTYALEDIDHILNRGRITRPTWQVTSTAWRQGAGPVVVLTPEVRSDQRSSDDISRPAQALVDGVLTLSREPQLPDAFSESIAQRISNIHHEVERDHSSLRRVTLLSVNGSMSPPAEVSEVVSHNARRAVTGTSIAYGSVVGVLDVISARRQRRKIGLLPERGPAITCTVEKLEESLLLQSFTQRVVVGGLVHRNSGGQIIKLDVDVLESLPARPPISARALVGVRRDLGGGLSASEYIAKQRGR